MIEYADFSQSLSFILKYADVVVPILYNYTARPADNISVLKQLTEFKMCFRRHLFSLREHPVFWLKFLVSPAERFFLRIKQGEKRKRCYPKSDFQL